MIDLKKLPDKPGVYFFLGSPKQSEGGKKSSILYVGKATSLRSRVRSYFANDIVLKRSAAIGKMVSEVTRVDFKTTDSVLEALILEAELIKKHKPYYNVREKDDKSFNFVVITDEDYPRVTTMRGKELLHQSKNFKKIFGPFPHGSELREALKIIRRIFPFRDKCLPFEAGAKKGEPKPCFNAQIGLCPGVCVGTMSRKEYLRYIRNIELFFEGKKSKIIRGFNNEMRKAAKEQDFEKAASLRNKIFALTHLNDVALLKRNNENGNQKSPGVRIEAYDIAHISGSFGVGSMVVVTDGEVNKNEYRRFKLRGVNANRVHDVANLEEVLRRRTNHSEWPRPDLVVVDGAEPQRKVAELVFKDIPVVAVVKDDKHKPKNIVGDSKIIHDYHREILIANSEAHRFAKSYHTKLRGKIV